MQWCLSDNERQLEIHYQQGLIVVSSCNFDNFFRFLNFFREYDLIIVIVYKKKFTFFGACYTVYVQM